jgi:hypothetical protein
VLKFEELPTLIEWLLCMGQIKSRHTDRLANRVYVDYLFVEHPALRMTTVSREGQLTQIHLKSDTEWWVLSVQDNTISHITNMSASAPGFCEANSRLKINVKDRTLPIACGEQRVCEQLGQLISEPIKEISV